MGPICSSDFLSSYPEYKTHRLCGIKPEYKLLMCRLRIFTYELHLVYHLTGTTVGGPQDALRSLSEEDPQSREVLTAVPALRELPIQPTAQIRSAAEDSAAAWDSEEYGILMEVQREFSDFRAALARRLRCRCASVQSAD